MRIPRFSISTLLVVIAILGVAMAALRSPSYLWANVTFTVALLAVLAAIACAIVGRGARRAYWLGFSLFGGTYLVICSAPGLHDSVCPRLATETLLDFIYPPMAPAEFTPPPAAVPLAYSPPSFPTVPVPPPAPAPGAQPQPAAPTAFVYYTINTGITMPTQPATRWVAWTRPDRSNGVGSVVGTVPLVSSEAFRQIGHSLFALLLATLGAAFSRNRYEAHCRLQSNLETAPVIDHEHTAEA
jgi:hypothetical protein